MAAPIYWTADMVRALPEDGKQYETVHGELLVSPAPRAWHEEIVGRLYEHLRGFVRHGQLALHWAPEGAEGPCVLEPAELFRPL